MTLEHRIRARLLTEGTTVPITTTRHAIDINEAAHIAALEAEDSYRLNAVIEALQLIVDTPLHLKDGRQL